ncbi:MAG: FAD-dependent oxidoreductase, partial [Eggerthellaceae bacterium]|nr:FAD-dependent oxidoreductase [Eggerthellaceae bacterium]
MTRKADNGTMTRVSEPYGGSTVEARKAAMTRGLSEADIAHRNEIPATAPNGDAHRIIAEEVYSENNTFVPYKPAEPNSPGPASAEPLKAGVLKEGQKITDRIGVKVSQNDPDYWGLASVMTDEEAELTAHMKVRKPMTFAELLEASGIAPDALQEMLDELSIKGILEYNWENLDGKNPNHETRYVLPRFVPGSAEFTVMNQQQIEDHPELGTFFERMTFLPLEKVTMMVPPGGAGIGMHVIPVERAIECENEAVDVERLSHWLKKYDRFSVGACSCRLSERIRGDNAGSDPQNWCVGVGDMADYCVETGKGHFATLDEVLDLLVLAEKNGYVHQITNIDGEAKIFGICNCDVNICYALRTSQLFNTPNMSRSAYVAHVEREKCVACAGCVEVCPAGAVQLGQKLGTLDGRMEYPRQPLPTLSWSKDDWDFDYKNNNRIECHDTGTAPCKTACPAHISVQGYLRMASEGRYRDALALIKKENPFPAVCGRICNRRCEAACTRGAVDEAVAIDEVKKFIAEQDLVAEHRFVPEVIPPTTRGAFPEKIAIVGAGPAGLSCAYYLATLGYKPVVFERDQKPGGMMTYGIPAYKLAKDVVDAEIDVLRELGVEIRCGVEVGRDVTLDELRAQGFKAFYLAIGCQGGRRAGVEGEDLPGVTTAVEFLREALADPKHEMSGNTVVIGGGNVAIDAARVAMRCGSEEVTMVCLEQADEMPALPEEIAEAEEDGVRIVHGWGPARMEAHPKDGRVSGVHFKHCDRVFDDEGRFSPVYDESNTMAQYADNVILAIGQSIEWGNLLDGSAVELGRGNGAVADPVTYQTAEPDIFVGGDVYTGPKFVIDAIAAGHEAAISLHRFVQTGSSLTLGRNKRHYVELDKERIARNPYDYDHAGRCVPECAQIADKLHNWDDPRRTFTEEQIRTETARCLSCGASVVDPNKCIGCGLCTTRCEFDAIHLHRDNPNCSTMIVSEDKLKAVLPNAG